MARHALGKGLSALIREPEPGVQAPPPSVASATKTSGLTEVDIDLIDPNPFQPRAHFAAMPMAQLADSIRRSGVLQPIVLRPMGKRFQIIAGERRWRAAQEAALLRIPAIIRELPDQLALEITLIENLQREDLNPVEQARGFRRLMSEFNLTQEEVAEKTGKERSTVANTLRLLDLDVPIIELLEEGRITAGHGRALLRIPELQTRMELAGRAAMKQYSVRQLELMASRRRRQGQGSTSLSPLDANEKFAVDEMRRELGTRVILKHRTRKAPGRLIIEFYDNEQLVAIYDRIMKH
jgi:ParB family chromosome partitioning protein